MRGTGIPLDVVQSLVLDAPIGEFVTAMDGQIITANPAYVRLSGYAVEALQRIRPFDIVHPDDLQAMYEGVYSLIQGHAAQFNQDRRLLRPDGTEVWVHGVTTLVRDGAGEPCHFLTFVHEITTRRAAEDELRASEAQYRAVLDALQEGITVHRPDSTIISCNASAPQILGLTKEELLGRRSTDPTWKTLTTDGLPMRGEDNPAGLALRTGQSQSVE